MKLIGLISGLMLAISLTAACQPITYRVPQGYRTCRNDYDCDKRDGEFCGFVGVDTYAVCRR